jgi:accessory gene regulator B
MAAASASWLVSSNAICEADWDVYKYGFHAMYNNIVDIASIAAIAHIAKMAPETIAYHIAFVPMRNTAGGWHAKTHLRCFALSTAMFAASLCGIAHTVPPYATAALGLFSAALVWASAPIEHENSPLKSEKRSHMKKLARTLSTVFAGVIALIEAFGAASFRWIALSLAYGMASQSLLALMALWQKRVSGKWEKT